MSGKSDTVQVNVTAERRKVILTTIGMIQASYKVPSAFVTTDGIRKEYPHANRKIHPETKWCIETIRELLGV
jgi:hypothetical protein